MKTIADEIQIFLEATGVSQATLSATSGVPASTICNLLKGKRKNLLGPNQDAIRSAMQELREKHLLQPPTDISLPHSSCPQNTQSASLE